MVFASSSEETPATFAAAATALGGALAARGCVCVNGGGRYGGMGALNAAVDAAGGRVRMVIHQMFIDRTTDYAVNRESATRIEVVVATGADLSERKRLLMEDAAAVIVLPGGCGTWDELCEAICEVQLGLRDLPICLCNVDGFYDGFLALLERGRRENLVRFDVAHLCHSEATAQAALDYCLKHLRPSKSPGASSAPASATPLGAAWRRLSWPAAGAAAARYAAVATAGLVLGIVVGRRRVA